MSDSTTPARCTAVHPMFGQCIFGDRHRADYHSDGEHRWTYAPAPPMRDELVLFAALVARLGGTCDVVRLMPDEIVRAIDGTLTRYDRADGSIEFRLEVRR